MNDVAQLRDFWEKEYVDTATPFDAEEPDEWIAGLERKGEILGSVLDAGCGPGRTSLYLADLGYSVLGVDISSNAIERAKRKAAQRGSKAQFRQADMCELTGFDAHFDTVIDIGCFHSLDDNGRAPYATALYRICRPEAVVYLRAFSERGAPKMTHESGRSMPALTEEDIRNAFLPNGWLVKDLLEREIELSISEDTKIKKYCWFARMHYM